jgi:hypothetical protein
VEWNLRDRLQQAEAQRRLAAGLPASDLEPAEAAPEPPRKPATIDLTDPSHVLAYAPERAQSSAAQTAPAMSGARVTQSLPGRTAGIGLPVWQGTNRPAQAPPPRPTRAAADTPVVASKAPVKDRCPSCQGKVRLERFDLDAAVAHMRCTECGQQYVAKSPKL